jgi:hypothetical protein
MSGLVASVAGFAMAVVVTGSRRIHRSNSLEETSQSIRDFDFALPIEHYDVKSHEDYKQEKHKLFAITLS